MLLFGGDQAGQSIPARTPCGQHVTLGGHVITLIDLPIISGGVLVTHTPNGRSLSPDTISQLMKKWRLAEEDGETTALSASTDLHTDTSMFLSCDSLL